MAEQDDITLISILTQAKQVNSDYELYESDSAAQLANLEDVISDLNLLIDKAEDPKDKNELLRYKSTLYQLRSGIQSEIKDMKNQMKTVNQIESTVEKAIKWNIGDIF